MREITILYDGGGYTFTWLKPLLWAQEYFEKRGCRIKMYSILDYLPFFNSYFGRLGWEQEKLSKACKKKMDIVFLAFHHSTSWLGTCDTVTRISILEKIRTNSNIVCWFDTADSTGTCLFDVMPYVDVYFKKQRLIDIEDYTKPYYGGRYFCQYYHDLLGVEDEGLNKRDYPPCPSKYLGKIKISWNLGFSDLFEDTSLMSVCHMKTMKKPQWGRDPRVIYDLHYRGRSISSLIGYQRNYLSTFLESQNQLKHPDPKIRVSKKHFQQELKRSKTVLSPFGWGEVCFRDFEAFAYGATLLKPSMSHCETWPGVYLENETYVPIKWDFSNLRDVMAGIGSEEYEQIAQRGFQQYKMIMCEEDAKDIFAKHIIDNIPV